MRNILIGLGILVVLGGAFFLITGNKCKGTDCSRETSTYSSSELGFQFTYPSGDDGYKIIEQTPPNDPNIKRVIVLMEKKSAGNIPQGGEYPPTITVLVLPNPRKQEPRDWADKYIQYSNINLGRGDITDTVIGGAHAIRYAADGLYSSDNVIIAHGDNTYVFSSMYLDENSATKKDFGPLLNTVTFIPVK